MSEIINRVLRRASEEPPRIERIEFSLSVLKSTYQNAHPPSARFGRYRAEIFRVDTQKCGAQRLAGAFFRKMIGVEISTSKVEGQVTKNRKVTPFKKSVTKFC